MQGSMQFLAKSATQFFVVRFLHLLLLTVIYESSSLLRDTFTKVQSTYVHNLEYTVAVFLSIEYGSGSTSAIFDSLDPDGTKKCYGSGSVGALCFWASWIRIWIVIYLYGSDSGSGSFHQQAKKEEKPLFLLFSDCFKTFIFEE
jgi:hypothetical protein